MYSSNSLKINAAEESERIAAKIQSTVGKELRKKGVVVAMSGGIDSSVVAALCVKAIGKERVMGLFLPEQDSSEDSLELGSILAKKLGINTILENITGILKSIGCYARRNKAIRKVIPDFGDDWRVKIVLPSVVKTDSFRIFYAIAVSPDNKTIKTRLTPEAYLHIVAATNFKQRTRKMMEYYHADRLNYAVAGTPNRLEYDQGFFVKLGDGAADFKPIAHLYKSQVYQLAENLGVPIEIITRPPTTDTYSMPQGQDEFYFSLPYHQMDLCLFGKNNNISKEEVAAAAKLTAEELARVYRDIDQKRRTTRYLHMCPVLMEGVREIEIRNFTS
jgi:NAD+ synthase